MRHKANFWKGRDMCKRNQIPKWGIFFILTALIWIFTTVSFFLRESFSFLLRKLSSKFRVLIYNITWRRKWQPTPVSLSGKSSGQWNLVGCSPRGRKESATTERLTLWLKHLWGTVPPHRGRPRWTWPLFPCVPFLLRLCFLTLRYIEKWRSGSKCPWEFPWGLTDKLICLRVKLEVASLTLFNLV